MKNIKKIFILLTGFLFVQTACTNDLRTNNKLREYSIKGNIKSAKDQKIILLKIKTDTLVKIDSTHIKNGKFLITGKHLKTPEIFYIEFTENNCFIDFFAENSDISITSDLNIQGSTKITGSKTHEEYTNFIRNNSVFINKLNDIYRQKETAKDNNDTSLINELDSISLSVFDEQTIFMKQFALQNPQSHVALFAGAELLPNMLSKKELFKLYLNFSDSISDSPYFIKLQKIIDTQKSIEVGHKAPNFCIPDSLGNKICLENFKGKYVLINFWTSFSDKSRAENKKIIKNYKKENLELIFISLDADNVLWKNSVKTDKLTGIQLRPPKGINSEVAKKYGIRKVPTSFLIDPQGIISEPLSVNR